MNCSSCKHENSAAAKFCELCGAKLQRACTGCGQALSAVAMFCPNCGQATTGDGTPQTATARSTVEYMPAHLASRIRAQQQALEGRGAAEGERKTITVLFADLKGSTALLDGLDPEVARAVIDPSLQIMMDAVHRYEGYVAQALGDGILALFGAPLAHEDHAQRAVFAALRMQEELKRYSDSVRLKFGAPLAMRVGLNTGEVVVRSIRKDDLHTDYVPVGHSINLAARMEQMATPGSILMTAHTAKLVEGFFALKSLGAAEIKGVEQPLPVFEVTGLGQLRTRLQVAASRGLTRFVGRHQELQQMQQALALARAGHGQVIGIMGEPGMGKSRLVHEFKASAQGFAIFEAYSASHGKASPYLPLTELLKGYFQIQLQDDEQSRREKIIGKLLGLDRSLEAVLPYYFALLNLEDADSPLPQMDAPIRRRRTFDALKRVTLRASLEQPLVLIFEDLHWIDSETQGYLDGLVESIGSARILLLTNYRPEYRHDWGAKTYCTQLRLAPFGHAEAEEFLSLLLGEPADSSTATRLGTLRQWILEKTEGTPFFMEEVVQELFEQGILQRNLHGDVLLPVQAMTNIQIPTTVQGVLAARIDRLAPEEKALLQQLAVIGRAFPFSLARAVVGTPEDALHQWLSALQKKEFLYEQPAFPEVEYLFKHALTQEVAYNTLLHETRKVIHEKTAQAIETARRQELDDHYGSLAHHYTRSGNVEKAIEYSQLAGTQAVQRSANAEAVKHFDTAVRLLESLPATPDRQRQAFTALMALAVNLSIVKGIAAPAVGEAYRRARALWDETNSPTELCAVLIGLRVHHFTRGDCLTALDYVEELARAAEPTLDPALICHGLVAKSITNLHIGNIVVAPALIDRGLAIYDFERDRYQTLRYGFDAGLAFLAIGSHAYWLLGYPERSRKFQCDALALAQKLNSPYMTGFVLAYGAAVHYRMRGDHVACLTAIDLLLCLAEEHGFPDWYAFGTILRGWALSCAGQAGGLSDVRHGLRTYAQSDARFMQPTWLGSLAEVHANEGELDLALEAIDEGLAVAEQTAEHWFDPELYRLRGEFTLRQQDGELTAVQTKAEQDFEHAIQIAQQQQAKSWELCATMSLAKLMLDQGRSAEARARLAAVYGWFTEGFDTPDLQQAKALIAQLSSA